MQQTHTIYLSDETITKGATMIVELAHALNDRATFDVRDVRACLATFLNVWPESVRRDLDAENYQARLNGSLPTPAEVRSALTPNPDPADMTPPVGWLPGEKG